MTQPHLQNRVENPSVTKIILFYLSVFGLILGLFALLSLNPYYARSFVSPHYNGDEIPALLFLIILMYLPTLAVIALIISDRLKKATRLFLIVGTFLITLIFISLAVNYILNDPYSQSFPREFFHCYI